MERRNLKEKGITLVALVVTIIILLILAGVTISAITSDNGLFKKAREATNLYKDSERDEQGKLTEAENELSKLLNPSGENPEEGPAPSTTEPTNKLPTFSTDYGRIDVIWLNGNSNTVAPSANTPNLYSGANSLTPVTWSKDGENWKEDETAQSTWYDYSEENRYWANAKNSDGSYFVWIPRYAYRITYYSDPECTKVTGYYDGYGMYDAINGTLNYKVDEGIETVNYKGMKYIVHPAFTGIGKEDNGGGFGTDAKGITGLWVAKFESSKEKSSDNGITWITDTSGGDVELTELNNKSIRVVSKPHRNELGVRVKNWTEINASTAFINAFRYDREKESHLMKNSEWGAVAYLTYSKFGTNGNDVGINNDLITGVCTENYSQWGSDCSANTFETRIGTMASSTTNVYGIYDLYGCGDEIVAGFDKESSSSEERGGYMLDNTRTAGNTLESTKYVTTYSNGTDDNDSGSIIFNVSKMGDGIKEVFSKEFTASPSSGWLGCRSRVVYSSVPFFWRGGDYQSVYYGGIFCSNPNWTDKSPYTSYRISLA